MQLEEDNDEYRPSTGDYVPPLVPIAPWSTSEALQNSCQFMRKTTGLKRQ